MQDCSISQQVVCAHNFQEIFREFREAIIAITPTPICKFSMSSLDSDGKIFFKFRQKLRKAVKTRHEALHSLRQFVSHTLFDN